MPTFVGDAVNGQILLITAISIGSPPSHRTQPKLYQSLLDTGAQVTLVTKKVVDEVGLLAIGPSYITPVSGKIIQTEKFRVRIDIPITSQVTNSQGTIGTELDLRGKDLEVSLFPYQPHNYDILLGMDFLSGFHFTMFRGRFILSS